MTVLLDMALEGLSRWLLGFFVPRLPDRTSIPTGCGCQAWMPQGGKNG